MAFVVLLCQYRIILMRKLLRDKLETLEKAPGSSPRSWEHITSQIGMFCYSGLTLQQVLRLRSEFHIYCTDDGRFSMAGINTHNVDHLAESMYAVIHDLPAPAGADKSEL